MPEKLKFSDSEIVKNPEALAKHFGICFTYELIHYQYVNLKIQKIPYLFAKEKLILPLAQEEGATLVAVVDPFDMEALEEVRFLLESEIKEIVTSKEAIEEAIERCYHQKDNEASELIASLQQEGGKESFDNKNEEYDLLEKTAESPVIRLLNVILTEAIQQGASDIHFEPLETGIFVRYRIDGILQLRHSPPKEYQAQLITRIKVMAKLDIAEQRLPQDGRIKLKLGGRQIDFRVSTIPVVFGERIVLRILDKTNIVLGLNKIGMSASLLESFKEVIHQSEGIVLVTGPTGSGKTTTLYSALAQINSSEINIMTVEDPVEYKLQGMAQIGVNPKIHLNFATGLRHILRQDPDVIMIGEIRDKETAEIAIQASLTGHLVLSTLHTNDAPSALTRLVDMGVEPYLLSSSVLAVLAQRLVRVICSNCKVAYTPLDKELLALGLDASSLEGGCLFKGSGCEACFGLGYKGRHALYELMMMTNPIKRQLLKSADAIELQKIAFSFGMDNLRQSGAKLASLGITTCAEVLRVTREYTGDDSNA